MVGILSVGFGNIGSLYSVVLEFTAGLRIVSSPRDFYGLSHLIIPGVGSFSKAMDRIHDAGVFDEILSFADSGRPLLGICVGMQILGRLGYEGGRNEGLGLIDGEVRPLKATSNSDGQNEFTSLHIGWNDLNFAKTHPAIPVSSHRKDFYFIHSYAYHELNPNSLIASSSYLGEFPAIIGSKNILGYQFHAEKSGHAGVDLIEGFLGWDGKC